MTFDEHADFILQSIASHDRQIVENAAGIRELREAIAPMKEALDRTHAAIDKLIAVAGEHSSFINSLARIAESHEQRISKIEETR